jgi:quercetin dioxygenase-like cupin family protein
VSRSTCIDLRSQRQNISVFETKIVATYDDHRTRRAGYAHAISYAIVDPASLPWITRPHQPGEPARHVAELSAAAGFAEVRANLWRYEPEARGRRHRHPTQEETFLVVAGTLSMYVGEPPTRHDVATGSLIRVSPGTPVQAANHGEAELVLYVHGFPPEDESAEILDDAV